MIGDIAQLIFAIATLTGIGLAGYALYRPPELFKRLKRLKAWELEAEIGDRQVTDVAVTATALPAAGESTAPPTSSATDVPPKEETSASWVELLTQKKYDEARHALTKEYVGKEPAELVRMEALFLWYAIDEGYEKGFGELAQHAKAHPDTFASQFFHALALSKVGQPKEALSAVQKAYSVATDASERLSAATWEARLKLREGIPVIEAARIISKELPGLTEPSERARGYEAIAEIFDQGKQADPQVRSMMIEAALRSDPTNKRRLFDVAYNCSENKAPELALFHYRQLLEIDPDSVNGLNNAGVAAEKLELPVTSVRYYRQAEEKGESLSSANLASRLISAGFTKEANDILEKAKQQHGSEVHRNVPLNIGKAAEAEEAEETKLKASMKRAGEFSRWKARCANAILQAQSAVSGKFEDPTFTLEIDADGSVKGTAKIAYLAEATVTGTVQGALVSFTWQAGASSTFSFERPRNGYGRAIVASASRLEGYWSDGAEPLDSSGAEKWKEFVLEKKE
jgi:tetratricopeptide (TPR) repeat protein